MSSLNLDVASIHLKNPTMLASGIMDETGASMLKVARAGAGALVTKSIGLEPRKGYPNPTFLELENGYLNAMGLPGPGIDAFGDEIRDARSSGVPVIGSIFAATKDDFATLAKKMEGYGADGIELNLSCPHAKGYGMEIGIDPEIVRDIVTVVKRSVSVPVLAKLTPNTHRLVEVGRAVQEAGGDGIVAINTVKAMAISTEFRRPVLYNHIGGLSGPAIKPIGLRCVYELYSSLDLPIIGVEESRALRTHSNI